MANVGFGGIMDPESEDFNLTYPTVFGDRTGYLVFLGAKNDYLGMNITGKKKPEYGYWISTRQTKT
jgi:hypothetical protein